MRVVEFEDGTFGVRRLDLVFLFFGAPWEYLSDCGKYWFSNEFGNERESYAYRNCRFATRERAESAMHRLTNKDNQRRKKVRVVS